MFWGSKRLANSEPYSSYPHAIYRYQHAQSLVLAVVIIYTYIYIHTYIHTYMHQMTFLCRRSNSVSQWRNTVICAAVNISFVVLFIDCHSGSLKWQQYGWSGKAVRLRTGGGIVWRKFTMAADDSRHSTRTLSVCSAQRHLCTVVLGNYRRFDR